MGFVSRLDSLSGAGFVGGVLSNPLVSGSVHILAVTFDLALPVCMPPLRAGTPTLIQAFEVVPALGKLRK